MKISEKLISCTNRKEFLETLHGLTSRVTVELPWVVDYYRFIYSTKWEIFYGTYWVKEVTKKYNNFIHYNLGDNWFYVYDTENEEINYDEIFNLFELDYIEDILNNKERFTDEAANFISQLKEIRNKEEEIFQAKMQLGNLAKKFTKDVSDKIFNNKI